MNRIYIHIVLPSHVYMQANTVLKITIKKSVQCFLCNPSVYLVNFVYFYGESWKFVAEHDPIYMA